ncbi:MAG: lysophospholipase L1-like esterase [Polaribacter sp.]|jgi:lysophospholipase L1-like esterase
MRKGLIFIIYGISLHLFIIILLLKSNAVSLISTKLFPVDKPIERTYLKTHTFYKRVNNNLTIDQTIFLGDSHIQGLAVSEVIGKSVNFGIGKDTVKRLINRMRYYDSMQSAKNIVIAVGINDLQHKSVEETLKEFKKLLKKLPKDVFVLVNGVFTIDEGKFQGQISNQNIFRLNIELKKIVNERSNSYFLDINPQLSYNGQLIEEYHIGDGIHLSEKGYHIWIQALTQTLNNLER